MRRKNRQMDAFDLILAERRRQRDVEGYTPEHDREHILGDLARAARCYVRAPLYRRATCPMDWPWARHAWKPTPDDRVRELVKAGALYWAEIERIKAEVHSVVDAIDDLRGTDSFAGAGPSLRTRLSYWLRPFDDLGDRRRWRWQPRTPCGAPPGLAAELTEAAERALDARPEPAPGPSPRRTCAACKYGAHTDCPGDCRCCGRAVYSSRGVLNARREAAADG